MKSFEKELAPIYPSLSAKLKEAADFVVDHPVEVATRSLRSIAGEAELAPATFTRMARAVGFETYEDLRDSLRATISKRANTFSSGVIELQDRHKSTEEAFISEHLKACAHNLKMVEGNLDPKQIDEIANKLFISRRVLVLGALGSTGIAEYMSYMANFISDNWSLIGHMGASLGSSLAGLGTLDAVIVITMAPFANNAIQTAQAAHEEGAYVFVITDTHTCPALAYASASLIIPTDSPHFFSAYAGILAVVETIIGVLAVKGGQSAIDRIAHVENTNCHLEYYRERWTNPNTSKKE